MVMYIHICINIYIYIYIYIFINIPEINLSAIAAYLCVMSIVDTMSLTIEVSAPCRYDDDVYLKKITMRVSQNSTEM
jgi:hypothetical protein